MTDHELCTLMKSDPHTGAEELYEQYYRYVYAIVFRLLRDSGTKEDVEDCVADTFVECITHADSIRGDSVKAYIGRAAHNNALNRLRTLQRTSRYHVPLEESAGMAGDNLSLTAEERMLQQQLLAEIEMLGDPDATILLQKYYYGRKMSEIARAVGLSTHAAQVRSSRALKRLQKKLKDWR